MIDAILSYHLHPHACGVAKFNRQLAERLGVPVYPLRDPPRGGHPLVSILGREVIGPPSQYGVRAPFSLFAHDDSVHQDWVFYATRVYAANKVIAEKLKWMRPDVIEAFAPSLVAGDASRGAYRVLAFGMAHKLLTPEWMTLKRQLDFEHGEDYTVELSCAVHEGTPWADTIAAAEASMRVVFGDKLRVWGALADDGLARLLSEVDAVALMFTPAVRANNTTYWAAVEAGKTIYTNRDFYSPRDGELPPSWDALVSMLREVERA